MGNTALGFRRLLRKRALFLTLAALSLLALVRIFHNDKNETTWSLPTIQFGKGSQIHVQVEDMFENLTKEQNIQKMEKWNARMETLHNRGKQYVLEERELELVKLFWDMRGWLRNQSHRIESECGTLPSDPPHFFDFREFNLWTESGDRIVARWVWKMQWLISNILYQLNNNHSEPTPKPEKKIFIGNLSAWDLDFFKPDRKWLIEGAISNCSTELLGNCYQKLDFRCSLSTQESDYWNGDVDIVVTHADTNAFSRKIQGPQFVPMKNGEGKVIPWFKYVMETPYIFPVHRDYEYQFIISHYEKTVLPHQLLKWVYYNPLIRSKHQTINYHKGKSKLAAIFVSNCEPANNRMEYVYELQKYIHVDIFGKCSNQSLTCPRTSQSSCYEMLRKDYFFYLSFENANCQDYVTEKFHSNGLGNVVVPVVLGAPPHFYLKHAPQNSYIHVEDFANPSELAKYLQHVASTPEAYNKYFEWVGTGEFLPYIFHFCTICEMLHYADIEPLPCTRVRSSDQWLPATVIDPVINVQMCLPKGRWYWN